MSTFDFNIRTRIMHGLDSKLHTPVLLKELIRLLPFKAGGTYIDGTFGAGGHTKAIIGLIFFPFNLFFPFDRENKFQL